MNIFDSYQIFPKTQKLFTVILQCPATISTPVFFKKWLDIIFFMIEYFISFINILIHFPTKNVSLLDQICFGIILFRLISLLCWNIPSNNSKYCVHCIKTNTAKFCNWINYWNGKTRNHLNMNLTGVSRGFQMLVYQFGFCQVVKHQSRLDEYSFFLSHVKWIFNDDSEWKGKTMQVLFSRTVINILFQATTKI